MRRTILVRHSFTAMVCCTFALTAVCAAAEEWNLRSADIPLTAPEVADLTVGNTLAISDDGHSKFSVGGAYSYTDTDDGGTTFGRFTIKDDGQVCIDFTNGHQRCDLYVNSGGLMVMISQTGGRFPIRVHWELRP